MKMISVARIVLCMFRENAPAARKNGAINMSDNIKQIIIKIGNIFHIFTKRGK